MTTPSDTPPTKSAASSPYAPLPSAPASSPRHDCKCQQQSAAIVALAHVSSICLQLDNELQRAKAENARLEAVVREFLTERKRLETSA